MGCGTFDYKGTFIQDIRVLSFRLEKLIVVSAWETGQFLAGYLARTRILQVPAFGGKLKAKKCT